MFDRGWTMKRGNIAWCLIFFLSVTWCKSSHGMSALGSAAFLQYGVPVLVPVTLVAYFHVKDYLRNRQISVVNANVQDFRAETAENFKNTMQELLKSKKVLKDEIVIAKKELGIKIDEAKQEVTQEVRIAKDELAQKIDTSRVALQELITKKIDESENKILSHIGTTRFDIVTSLENVKQGFEKRLDDINGSLEACVKLEDIKGLEGRLNGTLDNMALMITNSKEELQQYFTTTFLASEGRQKIFFKKQLGAYNKKSQKRHEILKKDTGDIKVLIAQKNEDLERRMSHKFDDTQKELIKMRILLEKVVGEKKKKKLGIRKRFRKQKGEIKI